MRTFEATVEVTVKITVNDENVIDRCVQNQDDRGVPQPFVTGGNGWRNHLYNLETPEDVIEMLAYNYVVNSRWPHELDGWADLSYDWEHPYIDFDQDRGAVHVEVKEIEHADG